MIDMLTWVSIPFNVNVTSIDISVQENFIELQNDKIMCAQFKYWKSNIWKLDFIATKYLLHCDRAQLCVIICLTIIIGIELCLSTVIKWSQRTLLRGDPQLSLMFLFLSSTTIRSPHTG